MLRPTISLTLFALSTLSCDAEPAPGQSSKPVDTALAVDADTRRVINRHLELMGLDGLAERYLDSVILQIESAEELPAGLVARIRKLAAEQPVEEKLVQFIAARIDMETLQAANAFLSTPLGRDYAEKQPGLVQGSNDFVRVWATQLSIQASNEQLNSGLDKGK